MSSTTTKKNADGPEDPITDFTTLPGGFRFNQAAAKAHVMEPVHTGGVVSSRGLEEGRQLQVILEIAWHWKTTQTPG